MWVVIGKDTERYQDGDCSSHDLENNNNINVVPVMNDTYL